jgi:hypothetical protein
LCRLWSLVEIGNPDGTIGQANQGDPTHDYGPTYYNSKRGEVGMANYQSGKQRHHTNKDADDTKTDPNHDFHLGSVFLT